MIKKNSLVWLAAATGLMLGASARAQSTCVVTDDLIVIQPEFIQWWADDSPGCNETVSVRTQFGLPTDQFAVGEPHRPFDDEYDDIIVIRDVNNDNCLEWLVKRNAGTGGFDSGFFQSQLSNCTIGVPGFGLVGDIAVVGHARASSDQAVVYRPSSRQVIIDENRNLIYDPATEPVIEWGVSVNTGVRERLLLADLPGGSPIEGWDSFIVWRPASRRWECYVTYIQGPTSTIAFSVFFGLADDVPVILDYNGDRTPDLAVWRPINNTLYVNLWEAGDPNSGYANDDIDVTCNYGSIPAFWNAGAFGINMNRTLISEAFITSDPANQAHCVGGSAVFEVGISGTAPLQFAWYKNDAGLPLVNGPTPWGSTISGAGTSTLVVQNARPQDAGRYKVTVANSCGFDTSQNAVLTVIGAPNILQNPSPSPQAVCPGETAEFSIVAESDLSMSYRWRRFGVPIFDNVVCQGSYFTGTGTRVLTLHGAQNCTAGEFDCIVTNACGSTITPGTGRVFVCPGDFDCDGDSDSDDVVGFFSSWDSGDSGADTDGDGDTDSDDIIIFFAAWDSGC